MSNKYRVLALTLLVVGGLASSGVSAWDLRETPTAVYLEGRIDLTGHDLQHRLVQGYDLVELAGGQFLTAQGEPMLPTIQIKVALPSGLSAAEVRVGGGERQVMSGTFTILPAQPPRKISARDAEVVWIDPDPAIYTSDEVYPASPVRIAGETDLAGQGMAWIEICPFRYEPRSGKLTIYTEMELEIECRPGRSLGDQMPERISAHKRQAMEERLRAEVVNPDHVAVPLAMSMSAGARLDPGEYDYVIITQIDLSWSFEPLADWKTQKGVPAKIVTTSWIYDQPEYTGTDEEQIRAFIIDAHNTWGADYFLLGGDTNLIPCDWWATSIEPYNVPNDTFYGDFDDDWTTEVHIGRAPVRYQPDVYNFVEKILTYEKNPPLTDYAEEILLLGFDLDNDTPGEVACQYIDTNYVPGTWNATCIYDSDPGEHKDAVIAAFDAGQNLANHIDHSDTHEMGVGSIHHDDYLYVSNIEAFVNEDRVGTVYSLGCWANNYEAHFCIGEHFVSTTGGGGVAFVGNSRYGWYNPGMTSTLSFRYDRYFFRSIFDQGHTLLGEAFTDHKNAAYQSDNTMRYIYKELTLIGDPELPLWMSDPAPMTIDCPPAITTGAGDFTVHVAAEGGSALSGARVCLWKNDDLYLIGYTDAGGDATFTPNAQTTGTMLVTATLADYLPEEREVTVGDQSAIGTEPTARTITFLAPLRDNPVRGPAQIRYSLAEAGTVDLAVFDLSGRRVRTLAGGQQAAGEHVAAFNGRNETGQILPAGVYLYQMRTVDYVQSHRLVMLP